MRNSAVPSSALTLRRFTETRDTNRFSIGEVLSKINPHVPVEIERRLGPPVDFSFCEGKKMADFSRRDPRDGPHSYIIIPVMIPEEDMPIEKSELEEKKEIKKNYCKYVSNAIRLSNNSLSSFNGLGRMLEAVLDNPQHLEWIDLSFNDLSNIDEGLLHYTNLKVLYLHANVIYEMREIDKLAALPRLKTLTLHGNVFDGQRGYRMYIISKVPQLQCLDFSRVTKADREKANAWCSMNTIDGGGGGSVKRRKPKK